MMKRFIFKILVTGTLIISSLLLLELLVRSVPNEYSYKYNYLENNIDKIQVLSVGSSVGRSGIDPSCFDLNTFNAANVSQDLETDCAIINKYINKTTSLEYVVLPLLPMSYTYRTGEGKEGWRLRRYRIFMNLNVEPPKFKESFEASNPQAACGQILRHILNKPTVECFENGQGNDTEIVTEKEKIKQGADAARAHNEMYKIENYKIIIPIIENTIRECRRKNIKVLLVLMPTDDTYYKKILPEVIKESRSISSKLETEYENCKYLDLLCDDSFCDDDFRNSNHLSLEGARKLSIKLNEILKQW